MPAGRIVKDVQEFIDILRGRWRKDLKSLLERGEMMLPRPGEGPVVIAVDRINIPRLRFASPPEDADLEDHDDEKGNASNPSPGDRGVGKGPGKPGTPLGRVQRGRGKGKGGKNGDGDDDDPEKSAGLGRGSDLIKVEISPEELMELFREILNLPWIQPKGTRKIKTEQWKYTDIRRQGPQSLLHRRRTMKEAMKRVLATGKPGAKTIPIREDMRYKMPEKVIKPKNNAVIFYMMDVSGSMGVEERRIVRYLCALCSFWLSWNYDGLEEVWIIHDGEADRVTRDEFFATYRGGGTVVSTAHTKMLEIVEQEFPANDWNIYAVYLSDGFNWGEDNNECYRLLKEKILPIVNQYAYGEVSVGREWWTAGRGTFSPPGDFGKMIEQKLGDDERVAWAVIKEMEQVPDAIKRFFGKGR